MGVPHIVDITVGNGAQDLVLYGSQLFVAVGSGTQVAIVDTTTNVVSGHIDVGAGPQWMTLVETTTASGALDPRLYVARGPGGPMMVVCLAQSNAITAQFPLDEFGGQQITIGQLADSHRDGVYVLDLNSNRLLLFSTQTNAVVEEITLGPMTASRMAVSADGSRVYLTHPNDRKISVIDTTVTPSAITPVAVAQYPWDVHLSPRGDRLYMTHWISRVAGLFRVIDLTTMLASSVNTSLGPWAVAGNDDRAYVSCLDGKCIQVLDTTTVPPQLLETISIDGSPGYVVIGDDDTLYADDFGGAAVLAVTTLAS